MTIRVVVADDQTVVREALEAMLSLQPDLDVVGTAPDGQQAVVTAQREKADVVLMDLNMPVLDGADATAQLRDLAPQINVLVLTTYGDDASILRALDAGARGYLTKDAGREQISTAIRSVAAGQSVLDPQVQARLLQGLRTGTTPTATARPAGLTAREEEVLRLIAAGHTNREIARSLVVSEGTVKTHINNLFAKIDVRDRAGAVRFAYEHHLGPA